MNEPTCECRKTIKDGLLKKGVEAHVTHVPPIVKTPYEAYFLTCPHGVAWYAQPTSEQIAAWTEAGAA